MKQIQFFVIFMFLFSLMSFASEDEELAAVENKIIKIRKEIAQVQSERDKVKKEIKRDKDDFEEYQNRTKRRMNRIKSETDSVRKQIAVIKSSHDSIAAIIQSHVTKKRQYDLIQEGFRQKLISSCDALITLAYDFPPMVSKQTVVALQFLRSELSSKSVDNIEGTQRVNKVINDLETITSNIQVFQGSSPTPEISGRTYRLRIGTVFEAVVNSEGTKYALWTGYDKTGAPVWQANNDPQTASDVLNAVKIREGKSIPDFVPLPFSTAQKDNRGAEE